MPHKGWRKKLRQQEQNEKDEEVNSAHVVQIVRAGTGKVVVEFERTAPFTPAIIDTMLRKHLGSNKCFQLVCYRPDAAGLTQACFVPLKSVWLPQEHVQAVHVCLTNVAVVFIKGGVTRAHVYMTGTFAKPTRSVVVHGAGRVAATTAAYFYYRDHNCRLRQITWAKKQGNTTVPHDRVHKMVCDAVAASATGQFVHVVSGGKVYTYDHGRNHSSWVLCMAQSIAGLACIGLNAVGITATGKVFMSDQSGAGERCQRFKDNDLFPATHIAGLNSHPVVVSPNKLKFYHTMTTVDLVHEFSDAPNDVLTRLHRHLVLVVHLPTGRLRLLNWMTGKLIYSASVARRAVDAHVVAHYAALRILVLTEACRVQVFDV
jgi:hypothetical protein